jgi:hypothetical protein
VFQHAIIRQHLTTQDDLQKAYEAVPRHSRLPDLKTSGLPQLL